MKKKNKVYNFIIIVLFIMGFLVFSYPFISNYYYTVKNIENNKNFDNERKVLKQKEIEERISKAQYYNLSLSPDIMYDPYLDEKYSQGRAEYARMLEVNEQLGYIVIPKIDINLAVYAGTNETVLQKGVGHMEGSSLPIGGEKTHSVLTAHTGLPSAKLFTDLDKLVIGDKFYLTNIKETLAYEVDNIEVVEPNDFSHIRIVDDSDYITLLTCTPYMVNSHRLLVRGHRIPYTNDYDINLNAQVKYIVYLYIVFIILIIILLLILRKIYINYKRAKRF